MRNLGLRTLPAVVAALVLSMLVGVPAKATDYTPTVIGGQDALQQYGAVSLWSYTSTGIFRHRCTAALIRDDWAVTAGHCLNSVVVGETEARTSALDNTSGDAEVVGVSAAYRHPGYDPDTNVDDIALVQLQHPIKRTEPLHLSGGSPAVGSTGKIAGWGWLCEDTADPACGRASDVLQELGVEIVDDTRCGWSFDPANQLCGVAAGGALAMGCNGDSGAPLVSKGFDGRPILRGVVVGDGDYDVDHPDACSTNVDGGQGTGLFVDVARYRTWIIDTIHGVGRS